MGLSLKRRYAITPSGHYPLVASNDEDGASAAERWWDRRLVDIRGEKPEVQWRTPLSVYEILVGDDRGSETVSREELDDDGWVVRLTIS